MEEKRKKAISYVVRRILGGSRDLDSLKRAASSRFGLSDFPRNSEIFEKFPKSRATPEIATILKRKPMRTLSGVAPIAVMIKPEDSCKWGCIYCPYTGKAPKSYTGSEPAALRARDNDFDPQKQVHSRLRQFELNGHDTSKCDVILMGGTFLAMDRSYKESFVKGIYAGLNGKRSPSLEQAKALNEKAMHRMVGLTMETRPDVCTKTHIDEMLSYGATKVELGVQNPSDRIYERINRGHSVRDVVLATAHLKDSAFKVAYHLMPGLPGSSPKKDLEMFKKVFSKECFRPDMLKIYPTLVIPGTGLFDLMEKGGYQPYTTEEAAEVLAAAYRYIPKYVRIMRIQRDIPSNLIAAGVKKSNLRELVERKASSMHISINEIRHRETGLSGKPIETPVMKRLDYAASKGEEAFLSIEDENSGSIAAFLRLRVPAHPHRKEIDEKTALVRELHVYGKETPLGAEGEVQHRGFGGLLLAEAEKIAQEEFGKSKMVVISGVGVRPYYYKRGYGKDGPYVSKKLQ